MDNEFLINLENKIQGYKTRIKEMHFGGSCGLSLHRLIDDFDKDFSEFEDDLMENAQALFGFIEPGELNPVLPEELNDFESLLEDIRGLLVSVKVEAGDAMMWTGIINIVDDFFSTVNKYIYQVKVVKRNKKED